MRTVKSSRTPRRPMARRPVAAARVRAPRSPAPRRSVPRHQSLPPSSPPPSSPPPSSPLPRASSPEFPLLLGRGPAAQQQLIALEEPDRVKRNKEIVELKEKVTQFPDNAVYRTKLHDALEDYKDDFGTWIPDSDLPVFDATRRDLLETRSIVNLEPLFLDAATAQFNPAYVKYFDGRCDFKDQYGVDIEPDDVLGYDIDTKGMGLFYAREIIAKSGGDLNRMRQIASQPFTIQLVNPYPQNDQRRAELDALYLEYLRYFSRRGCAVESPPDTATKTIFEWVCRPTLVDGELVETILSYMRGRSFRQRVEWYGEQAREKAGVVSADTFYGST
ncbi:hypothetical protein C8F04DRAFT_1267324 [Mycena alexandri]|uniref:Uncharacterized protein n=1 Tax=Mycena alexandri TaxID=1745969 RepID=A0AAD6SHC1_9AGAR|nr:hypothetical protein C8F04DRAFT_1267324 [Mycena alexandri]